MRPLLALQGVLTAGVIALAAVGIAWPDLVPRVPQARSDAAYALLAAGLLCCLLLANRAARTHALTRRPADLLVAVGCVWLGVALVAQLVIGPMTIGFYVGHGLELAAVALIAIPAALRHRPRRRLAPARRRPQRDRARGVRGGLPRARACGR